MPDDVRRSIAQHLQEVLTASGHRCTPTRRAIVDVLVRIGRPLTVSEIVKRSGAPISSAYRNLSLLVSVGVLNGLWTTDRQARFELADSFIGQRRHHLVCLECGSMADYVVPDDIESLIEAMTPQVEAESRFHVMGHILDLVGACAACTDQEATQRLPVDKTDTGALVSVTKLGYSEARAGQVKRERSSGRHALPRD